MAAPRVGVSVTYRYHAGSNIHPRISSSNSKQLLFQAPVQRFFLLFPCSLSPLITTCWHLQHTAVIVLHEAITFQLMMLRSAARLLCMWEMHQTNCLIYPLISTAPVYFLCMDLLVFSLLNDEPAEMLN